jgi:polyribonucleotide nucleotidyltransferase
MLRSKPTVILKQSTACFRRFNQIRAESTSSSVVVGEKEIVFKTGHIARFADGAVVIESGDTAILATVVSKTKDQSMGLDGLPLQVDFRQSAAAIGRIPTTYLRREMQQSDADIITSRIIDRSIRPMFPDGFSFDTQVNCKPLSLDENADSVVMAVNAASCALAISKVALKASVAAVRVGVLDGKIVINPLNEQLKYTSMNLLVSGTKNNRVVMIEMDGKEIEIVIFEEAIRQAFLDIDKLLTCIDELEKNAGKQKIAYEMGNIEGKEKILEHIKTVAEEQLIHILMDPTHDKISRDNAINEIRKMITSAFENNSELSSKLINNAWTSFVKFTLRRLILEQNARCDGRSLEEFRPISIEMDVYKKLHGSALFQRGQSQVFGTVTFDSPDSAFHPDSIAQLLGAQQKKSFFLHYEFPGFATNEFSSGRPFNRRELGHGVLAEKSLKHVIPENFPYCVRLACQVLESNGSTSMASACVGSLALFDAGVPIKNHVAGVAVGMVSTEGKETEDYRILTDILGIEDFAGDMDFKIAGTKRGFTAMQLDLKTGGLTPKQLIEAVEAGRKGIDHVLGKMNAAIETPRSNFKPTVPIMSTLPLPLHKRSILYRNGGYNVKLIQAETGVKISVEDDSNVLLFAQNPKKLTEAKKMIETMMEEGTSLELDFGAIYKVEIIDIQENGIFVRVKPGTRPLFIANRHLDARKVNHASALGFEIGQNINIQYLGRDEATGSHRFSRKMLQAAASRR